MQRRLGRKKKVAARGEVAWSYRDLSRGAASHQIKSLAVDPLRQLGCSLSAQLYDLLAVSSVVRAPPWTDWACKRLRLQSYGEL